MFIGFLAPPGHSMETNVIDNNNIPRYNITHIYIKTIKFTTFGVSRTQHVRVYSVTACCSLLSVRDHIVSELHVILYVGMWPLPAGSVQSSNGVILSQRYLCYLNNYILFTLFTGGLLLDS